MWWSPDRMWFQTKCWQEVCRFNTVRIGYSTCSYKIYKTPSSHKTNPKAQVVVPDMWNRLKHEPHVSLGELNRLISSVWVVKHSAPRGLRLVIVSGSAVATQTWPGAAPLVMWPPSWTPRGSANRRGQRGWTGRGMEYVRGQCRERIKEREWNESQC